MIHKTNFRKHVEPSRRNHTHTHIYKCTQKHISKHSESFANTVFIFLSLSLLSLKKHLSSANGENQTRTSEYKQQKKEL